jgi:NitT/TauT family transport system substrate-binding protein
MYGDGWSRLLFLPIAPLPDVLLAHSIEDTAMLDSLPKVRRRRALQLMAGATGAAVLHACKGASTSGTTAPGMSLSLGTISWMGQVPIYVAQEKGFYAEAGLDFELKIFGSTGEFMAAFLSNQLDSVSPVSSEAVLMKSQGKDYKIVMVQDSSVGGDGILAKDRIKSIADFKDQKVAVDTSGVSYFFLLQVLKEAGLSKDDIIPVNTDAAAAAAAFQSDNIDIAVTYAPYLKQADDAVKDGRIIYDSAKMPTAITDLYLFDTAYIEANPKAVQAFVTGTLKGLQFMKDNPDESITISAAKLEMEPADLVADLKGVKLPDKATNLEMLAQPDSDLYLAKSLEELADFLVAEGQIESKPEDLAALLDPQFVQASP